MNTKRRKWLDENAEKDRETRRRYREANKEKIREKKKVWRLANLERVNAIKAIWRAANRDREIAVGKIWRQNNLEKELVRNRQNVALWRKENPDKHRAMSRNYIARKQGATGSHTAKDIKEIISLQKGKCAYCRERLGREPHIDHIVALARGGTNHRSNLQATCKACNQHKHARDPIEFAQSLGLLI